jgi:hypothetical protein
MIYSQFLTTFSHIDGTELSNKALIFRWAHSLQGSITFQAVNTTNHNGDGHYILLLSIYFICFNYFGYPLAQGTIYNKHNMQGSVKSRKWE